MSTPGSRTTAAGLTAMLISVSAGIHFGDREFSLLLCFLGVLVGASLVVAGVRMADGRAPITPMVFDGARDLVVFMRRNTAAVGLVMASCAVTMASHPVLCFATFVLLLLGVSLINIGTRGKKSVQLLPSSPKTTTFPGTMNCQSDQQHVIAATASVTGHRA